MPKDYNKAPYHWRAGHGYLPPQTIDKPTTPFHGTYFAATPFAPPPLSIFFPCLRPCHGFSYPLGPSPLPVVEMYERVSVPMKVKEPNALAKAVGHEYLRFKTGPASAPKKVAPHPTKKKEVIKEVVASKPVQKSGTLVAKKASTVSLTATSVSSDSTVVDDVFSEGATASSATASDARSDASTAVVVKRSQDRTIKITQRMKYVKPVKAVEVKKDAAAKTDKKPTTAATPKQPTCSLHIIDSTTISLTSLTSTSTPVPRFTFRIYSAPPNSSVAELLAALGGGNTASVTQVWEHGGGRWKTGTELGMGSWRAERRLGELGWAGAGGVGRAPVWLWLRR